jgi:trimeric autotransporter adhesin
VRSNNRISLQTKDHKTKKKKMTSMNPLITSHYAATPKPSEGGSLLTILRGRSSFILIALVFGVFTLGQTAQAVVPAPDGGYAGGNTAEGQAALFSLINGTYNTGVGLFSLRSNTEGSLNTAIGAGTLLANTGSRNTATGAGALLSNTTAEGNTANGTFALFSNTIGENNTANGAFALFSSAEASGNTAQGNHALFGNTTGEANTATGTNALLNNTEGSFNTAIGDQAINQNTTGGANTAVGESALFSNTSGHDNTANGAFALFSSATGNSNTAIGSTALFNNSSTEGFNTATGAGALFNNTTGAFNTANGYQALFTNGTGIGNTAIGDQALFNNTTGIVNTALGIQAGTGVTTANNVICIGSNGQNVSNSCFIGNIRGVTTAQPDAIPVVIDSLGQLGTTSSSRRFKKEIQPIDKISESILALKPVTFHYKNDPAGAGPQFGLIAEEVAEVNPDLVVRDRNGEIYTVRYDAVNAMLLNEFLKEHKKVEEQQAMIAELRKEMETIVARLKEQDSRIQKVSAQIEMGNPKPQIVQYR